jgi:hypothetical protein
VSLITGHREDDGALVTRALLFRDYSPGEAEEMALRWGFQPARRELADGEIDDEHGCARGRTAGIHELRVVVEGGPAVPAAE